MPPAPMDTTWFATRPRGNQSMIELVSGCRVTMEIRYVFNPEDEGRTKYLLCNYMKYQSAAAAY